MKALLILALGFTALTASARVGSKFFSYTVSAPTEALLLEKVEDLIPQIQSGKVRDVFHRNSECWPNNSRTIKVTGVTVKKSYKVDELGSLNGYYIGSISYRHKRCRDDK